MITTGGGKADRPGKIIFNATFTYLTDDVLPNSYLYSYYEIDSPKDFEYLDISIKRGDKILIDSGTHGIYMAMIRKGLWNLYSPDRSFDIDHPDFMEYFQNYCDFIRKYERFFWGYVELDVGNEKQKTVLRDRMEAQGVYPIPVFHPLTDSSEYLDLLCTNYDRVCFGNIAMEGELAREIILQLVSVAKEKYPHLWIHALGIAPHPLLAAFPYVDSIDSSTSSSLIRFGRFGEGCCFDTRFRVVDDFCNRREDRESYRLGAASGYRSFHFHQQSWRRYFETVYGD